MDFLTEQEEPYSLFQFKNDWKNVLSREDFFWEDKQFGLYIANPFCIKKCNFCIYNPTVTKIGSPVFNEYYEDFLPNVIGFFNELYDIRIPDSIYFGGGTVNLISPKILSSICQKINHFDLIKSKHIECNPLLLTERMAETIVELGFNYVSFGVQTFNQELLTKECRKNPDVVTISKFVKYFTSRGIFVNCDLLAFLKDGYLEDLSILKTDLEILNIEVEPTVITIYPMYQRFSRYNNDFTSLDFNLRRYRGMREVLANFSKSTDYMCVVDLKDLSDRELLNLGLMNYKLIKEDKVEEYTKRVTYNSSGYSARQDASYNLGLGGHGLNVPYSYFGKNEFFYMYNLDNQDVLITKRK